MFFHTSDNLPGRLLTKGYAALLSSLLATSAYVALAPALAASAPTNAGTTYVSDLTWTSMSNGWGPVEKDMSNGEQAAGDGHTLSIRGATFAKGLGANATSDVHYNLAGKYSTFSATVGLDDESAGKGSVVFQVYTDGTKVYDSGLLTGTSAAVPMSVSVAGKQDLRLVVADGGDGFFYDHADWAGAKLLGGAGAPSPSPTPSPTPGPTSSTAAVACLDGTYGLSGPAGAYSLPVSQRDNLQQALDTYKMVRLDAGDYRGSLSQVRLSSGQGLFGVPGENVTVLPKVVVAGGTTNTILSGINPASLEFPAEGGVTKANCFTKLFNLDVNVTNASLESNLFLHLYNAKINVDTRSGGYLRNNRFIRVKVQSAWPGINLLGDAARQSWGNVWLWYNLLTPWGDGIYMENQADASFVGLDAESWNWTNQATRAMLTTGPMGTLRMLHPNGGQPVFTGSQLTGIFDISADEFQLYNASIGNSRSPETVLESQNTRSALLNVDSPKTLLDKAIGAFRLQGFGSNGGDLTVNGQSAAAGAVSAASQAALRQMFVTTPATRAGKAWDRPVFGAIADPTGPNWTSNLANQPDSTDYIQGLINTNGIARLPAGIFYISRPLQLSDGQGVIGTGEGQTAIVAKNNSADMIISNLHCDGGVQICGYHITLADLTLQGGRNGIHWDAAGAGIGAQIGGSNNISHVTFRNMAEAGIFVDGIMGLDNNYFDHLAFYQNQAGVKQRSNWNGSGEPGQSYLDKNVFFHSQFVANGRGLDLQATRQNTLNAWINSRFQDNTVYAADVNNSVATLFANTDFINNAGGPTVHMTSNWGYTPSTDFVSDYFRADARGQSMIGDGATCEGCVFQRGASTTASVLAGTPKAFFYNSRAADMPVGTLQNGILLNNTFTASAALSGQGVVVENGTTYSVVSGAANPIPQFLFGSAFR